MTGNRSVLVTGASRGIGRAIALRADSDAVIVKGLISLVLRLYSGRTPETILANPPDLFERVGLGRLLTPGRANGLYSMVERLAPQIISRERHIYKGVSANVDFYSGLTYSMLGIPRELFTPIFAMARIVGWSAHRMEELINADKIIRPAYKNVAPTHSYVVLEER